MFRFQVLQKTFIDGMHAVFSSYFFDRSYLFICRSLQRWIFQHQEKAKVAAFITFGILIITGLSIMAVSSANTPSIFIYVGIIILTTILAAAVIIGLYKQSSRIKTLSNFFLESL